MWLSRPNARVSLLVALTLQSACGPHLIEPPRDALDSPERVLGLAMPYLEALPDVAIISARASQYSDRGALKGKLEILVKRPNRVRFTGLSPTDDMVSVLATDGERFVSFQRGASICHVGRACAVNVGRFVSLPLEADELVGALLGRPPLVAHDVSTLRWDRSEGAYLLELTGSARDLGFAHGRTQRLWVSHVDGRILRTSLLDEGRVRVDIKYSEFKPVGGYLLPRRLDIQLARDETDLRLDLRDVELSSDIEDEAFRFNCPTGTILEELSCDPGGSP